MASRNRIPAILEPFIQLPPELSQVLITSTLGCSATWLTARFIGAGLQRQDETLTSRDVQAESNVILVSWLRDHTFWKSEIRRSMGIDTSKIEAPPRFTFIDCLTLSSSSGKDHLIDISARITSAVEICSQHSRPTLLILDQPDALLATGTTTASQLHSSILKFRSQVHSTIITCSADLPLLSAAQQGDERLPKSPLESECAAFVSQQAHAANSVMSVRELATGAARDVSGVLRITRGGSANSDRGGDLDSDKDSEELEALYLVNRDGTVKVFERGSQR